MKTSNSISMQILKSFLLVTVRRRGIGGILEVSLKNCGKENHENDANVLGQPNISP